MHWVRVGTSRAEPAVVMARKQPIIINKGLWAPPLPASPMSKPPSPNQGKEQFLLFYLLIELAV